jgi:Flp pilus assembly CpaE family ATPase
MPTPTNWAVVDQAHAILLVMQLTKSCLTNGHKLYDHILSRNIPKGRVLLVINRFREDFGLLGLQDVEERFEREVFAQIPSDYELVKGSTDMSHPLLVDAPTSPVRIAIQDMARRLLGIKLAKPEPSIPAAPRELPSPQPKLLERILKR